jgi:hypothetical protein
VKKASNTPTNGVHSSFSPTNGTLPHDGASIEAFV